MGDKESSGVLRSIVVISLISMLSIFGIFVVITMAASFKGIEATATSKSVSSSDMADPKASNNDSVNTKGANNPDYDLTINADTNTQWWFVYDGDTVTATLGGYWGGETNLVLPSKVEHNGKLYTLTSVKGDNSMSSKGLVSLKMPNTITSIGKGAFADNNLKSVSLSNNLREIGDFAFTQNKITGLVSIPDGVTNVGYDAFSHNQISDVYFGSSVATISDFAFYDNKLATVYIPDQVSSIGLQSFADNPLTKISVQHSSHVADAVAIGNVQLINR